MLDAVTLEGRYATLVPLDAEAHAPALHVAAQGDPELWTYLPYGPFEDVAALRAGYLDEAARSTDPRFLTVLAPGPVGVLSLMRFEPSNPTVEIGHVWFGAPLQRTPAATEAIFLAARHAFEDLRVRRLEWKCNADNARSRAAAERFGFTYEGTFRQHLVVKGRNRDTAWYSMLDREWPAVQAAFAAWLDPSNFDADGRQRRPLSATRSSGSGP